MILRAGRLFFCAFEQVYAVVSERLTGLPLLIYMLLLGVHITSVYGQIPQNGLTWGSVRNSGGNVRDSGGNVLNSGEIEYALRNLRLQIVIYNSA